MRNSVIKNLIAVSLVLVILFTCGTVLAEVTQIRTLERGVSLRTAPWVEDGNKILGIHANTTLDVYGETNGWYYVCYKGNWGYVASCDENGRALVTVVLNARDHSGNYDRSGNYGYEVEFSETDYSGIRIRTLSRGASLRSDPWVGDNNKLCGVHANRTLDVYGEVDGWYYVYYEGYWGYVASRDQNGNALVTVIPDFR